ncbi:hypothetical protein B0I35DRAFT_404065 [Stachybotrys elegans]|uniref:Cell wall proline rich protein n=1 Tax=Stachybotrys elegans TaxID=80388 RepID=A0A8K0T610_9HYPO|nr:hypothetical protein B0I35DRAFT_404065 [Stachybotrys elegans]
MSVIEPHNQLPNQSPAKSDKARRPSALPDFSFNPGASLPADLDSPLFLSPPTSPDSPRTTASAMRPAGHGHRRGGSEFVGGRLREGNSIAVMSTSPTKSEDGFSSPSFQPPRRKHRRGVSGNISVHDLPTLHPPFNPMSMKGSSAPTSPTNFDQTMDILHPPAVPLIPRHLSLPSEKTDFNQLGDSPEPEDESSKQPKPPTRTRVGFSDTVEFIPRPLSMVSSDTSSVATMRPGTHSVSGSISSIISITASVTPQGGRESPAPLSRASTRDNQESRPSTAGAVLERSLEPKACDVAPKRRNSIPALLDVSDATSLAPPTPSPSKSSKRWSFFGLDPFAGAPSPTKTRPSSSSSEDTTHRAVSGGSSSEDSQGEAQDAKGPKSKKGKKNKKKRSKKVKGWAGAILPIKPKAAKSPKTEAVRPPTPPGPALSLDDEQDNENQDVQNSAELAAPIVTVTESADDEWTKKSQPKRSNEESMHQMIDLDAALGPFNTPLPHNAEWEAAQRAAGNIGKRRLHSAQGMKGFSGPGMHYHRRAESAPDLPPFDGGRSSIHRFGSSSTMADVFEEDEEDEEGTRQAKAKLRQRAVRDDDDDDDDTSDSDVTPPASTPKDPLSESQSISSMVRRQSSGLSDKDRASTHSLRAERSRTSLQESIIIEEPSRRLQRSPLTNSGEFSPRTCSNPESQPSDIIITHPGAMPLSPYSMSHASSYPSPRSPVSVDAQRISTAPSSVADEHNFQSLLMGEPGPEVRISVDYDIPSLTSSNSTMTRDSTFLPQLRMPRPGTREQRPVSVSSAMGRRRSSLVSLSRLISSSHGERSKLSMEVTLDNEADRKNSKNSKAKRLGKMMQFWKSNKQDTSS